MNKNNIDLAGNKVENEIKDLCDKIIVNDNDDIIYKKSNANLMLAMNMTNFFTTLYIIKSAGIIYSIPHILVCITSYLFWRKPQYNLIRVIDYLAVAFTMLFSYIFSFIFNKEMICTFVLLIEVYVFSLSTYFKSIDEEDKCIHVHAILFLIGNIANVYVFTN